MSFHFQMRAKPQPAASYKPMLADAPEMYQVNNYGMELICRALSVANILDENCESPDFDATLPDWLSPERVDEITDALEFGDEPDPPMTEKERNAIQEAETAQQALLETRSPNSGKLPAFKFGSNDGWVVTAEECAIICSAIERILTNDHQRKSACPTDEARTLIENWWQYVSVAQGTGGFTVH
jgi:hypothetical protein